ncbi:MAG TPA: hypothetical protein VFM05_06455, partial [Candidatus Saccharimonadales bacterium]|nr:hypothetical protein [Candidatus Saccharimonadales bacterium]
MVRARESLTPLAEGPPSFNERQVTPGQLLDMRLGYLSNMGAEVELVTTETGRVVPVTIAAVGRSFWIDQKPDGSRLIPEDEIRTSPAWTDCPYVTFYTRNP